LSGSHEQISIVLKRLAAVERSEPWTLGEVLDSLEQQGVHALKVLLCIPFLFPMPIPGVSTVFGSAIAFLAVQEITGRRVVMPERVRAFKIDALKFRLVMTKASIRLERLERLFKRRWTVLCGRKALLVAVGVTLLSAALLALPIPPIIPFTNTLPAIAIICVALGCMWSDGVFVAIGYVALVATLGYFWAIGDAIATLLPNIFL